MVISDWFKYYDANGNRKYFEDFNNMNGYTLPRIVHTVSHPQPISLHSLLISINRIIQTLATSRSLHCISVNAGALRILSVQQIWRVRS